MEESIKIHFHNFAKLPSSKGDFVKSAVFRCVGYDCSLNFYPGGIVNAGGEGFMSLFLKNETMHKPNVAFDLLVMKANGKVYSIQSTQRVYSPNNSNGS
jgi:hypothetical protein